MRSLKNAPPVNGFVRRLRDTAGTSIVEAAIITPLLLLLTLSIVDFGALFYCYLALENGVSQATRFAVTGNVMADPSNPGTNLSRDASIKTGDAAGHADADAARHRLYVQFACLPAGRPGARQRRPQRHREGSVTYTWTFFNPMLWAFFSGGQITLNVDSAMKNEGAPPS